jgi:hypothetical protein
MPRQTNGMTCVDMVFPAMLFAMGMSIHLVSVTLELVIAHTTSSTGLHLAVSRTKGTACMPARTLPTILECLVVVGGASDVFINFSADQQELLRYVHQVEIRRHDFAQRE